MRAIYYLFIVVLLISKVAYLVSSAKLYYVEHKTPTDPTIPSLEKQTKRLLIQIQAIIVGSIVRIVSNLRRSSNSTHPSTKY